MSLAPNHSDTRQIMYHADTGMNVYNLWEPFTPDQLSRHIDDFADNGIDIFSQLTFAGGALLAPTALVMVTLAAS